MSSPPSVSVILPFRNADATLPDAIESILNQTFTDFELVLIDNRSNDESASLARRYASLDDRIKLITEEKRGVVFAANAGINQAQGALVARMDADDQSFPNRLLDQVNYLDHHPEVGLVSGRIEYAGHSENEGFTEYVKWVNGLYSPDAIALNQFVEYPMVNPSLLIRKSLFDQYGLYRDGDFPEDYEWFLRLQAAEVKMAKVRQKVLKWADLPRRLTRTDARYSAESFFRIKAKYLQRWLSKHNPYYPKVWVWGAGKLARRYASFLMEQGVEVTQWIDLEERAGVMDYRRLPKPGCSFILSYVSNRGARAEIRNFLNELSYREGTDYLICA